MTGPLMSVTLTLTPRLRLPKSRPGECVPEGPQSRLGVSCFLFVLAGTLVAHRDPVLESSAASLPLCMERRPLRGCCPAC